MKSTSNPPRRPPTDAALTLAEVKNPFNVTKPKTGFKSDEASESVEILQLEKSKSENHVKILTPEKYTKQRKLLEPEISLLLQVSKFNVQASNTMVKQN